MGNYRLSEVMSKDSVKTFMESKWLGKVLELNELNEKGERKSLSIYVDTLEGPGFDIVKGLHWVLYQSARPLQQAERTNGVPPWATHISKGIVQHLAAEYLKGYKKNEIADLVSSALRFMSYNDVYYRKHSRNNEFYIRAWPAYLTRETFKTTWSNTEQKPDWLVEKRITEEAEKSKETLVVTYDTKTLKLPTPDDPDSFVRYVGALKTIIDHKDKLIAEFEAEVKDLQAKLEEIQSAGQKQQWENAAQKIADIMKD